MKKAVRITTGLISGFVALTAIGGGVVMLTGLDEFPPEWLETTPFSSYTIPALLLAVLVGGSALVAAVLLFRNPDRAGWAALMAGAMMAGYVGIEAIILNQVPPGPTPIEIFYFILGVLMLIGGLWLTGQGAAQ